MVIVSHEIRHLICLSVKMVEGNRLKMKDISLDICNDVVNCPRNLPFMFYCIDEIKNIPSTIKCLTPRKLALLMPL